MIYATINAAGPIRQREKDLERRGATMVDDGLARPLARTMHAPVIFMMAHTQNSRGRGGGDRRTIEGDTH